MIPASIRNNNPGAMYPGKSAKRFGSTRFETLKSKDGIHKIACFDDPVHGAAAQFDLLSSKAYTGRTIREAITKWCGGYYASTYLKVLAENSGVTAETILTVDMLRNPSFAVPLAKAMALQEAGKPFPLEDEGWLKAHQLAFGVVLEPSVVVAEKAPDEKPVFAPDNSLPSPKPETRVSAMKKNSRKWSVISFVQRWFLKIPVGLGIASEAGGAVGLSMPDIPAIQENLNAAQSVSASLGNLGWIGWGLAIIVALSLVQKFMVEDAEDGRAVPSGGA
jgi:hypothetical protein